MNNRSKAKKIVAIDWDPRTLRVVHVLLGKRGLTIDRLLSVAIPDRLDTESPTQMGMHIRRTLDQEGITTKRAIVDVPRDQVILKTLSLPTAHPEGLPSMVEIQIAKELPFPPSEAVIDFTLGVKHEDSATQDVLVAGIRRELLERYQATFEAAGLKLDRVGLRPYASKVAVCELLKHAIPERVLFIDVRPTFMEIDVLCSGALTFSRSASVVVPDGAGEPPPLSFRAASVTALSALGAGETPGIEPAMRQTVVDSLVLEVTRSIEAYRANDPGARIDHVVIGGDTGVEEMLGDELHKRLNVSQELYNPASSFGWEPDEGVGASAFAASLGLVLSHASDAGSHFDFLHPKKTESVAKARLKKAPMVAAVVVLFATAGALGFTQYTKPARERLASLEKKITQFQARRTENRKFLKLYEQIEEFERSQHVWVDVLYEVFSLLPSNTELLINSIDMNQKDGRVTLKTQTRKRETSTEIVLSMEAYRRDGRTRPRFKASLGAKRDKKDEKYRFAQDIRITVLNDSSSKVKKKKSGR